MNAPSRRVGRVLALLAVGTLVAACGGGAPQTPAPTASPTPATTPTPDAHLPDGTRAQLVLTLLRERGVELAPTNAIAGEDPVARINGTYGGWPFTVVQYKSLSSRNALAKLKDGVPVAGEPPYIWAGMNIVFLWGPADAGMPDPPPKDQTTAARQLVVALDSILGPLVERSVERLSPAGTPRPAPSPAGTPTPTPSQP